MEVMGSIATTANPQRLFELQVEPYNGFGLYLGTVVRKGNYIYAASTIYQQSNLYYRVHVAKYALDGTLQWQAARNASGGQTNVFGVLGLDVDSAGNVCVLVNDTNAGKVELLKFTSAGALSSQTVMHTLPLDGNSGWARPFGATNQCAPALLRIDGNDNIYVGLRRTSTNDRAVVAKFNSGLVLQWTRELYLAAGHVLPMALDIDSTGAVFFSAARNDNSRSVIAKWDTSGAVAWKVEVNNNGVGASVCAPDSSGRIAALYRNLNVVHGIDSTGAKLWGKTLTGFTGEFARIVNGKVVVGGNYNNVPALVALDVATGALAWAIQLQVVSSIDGATGLYFNHFTTDTYGNFYVHICASQTSPSASMQTVLVLPHYVASAPLPWVFGNVTIKAIANLSFSSDGNTLAASSVSEGASAITSGAAAATSDNSAPHPVTRYMEL
jgi:hypothetical protein